MPRTALAPALADPSDGGLPTIPELQDAGDTEAVVEDHDELDETTSRDREPA